MLVRKAAHEVAGMELELCLRTVIVCVDDDGPKLLAPRSRSSYLGDWHRGGGVLRWIGGGGGYKRAAVSGWFSTRDKSRAVRRAICHGEYGKA